MFLVPPQEVMARTMFRAMPCGPPSQALRMARPNTALHRRSTFYVSDCLRQRPMLSVKEPNHLIHAAMDTIYSA